MAKIIGWRYYHTWRSIHSPAGFPDCVFIRDGTVIFAELKAEKGKLSDAQEEWIADLERVAQCSLGVQVYVWRPKNIEDIAEVLK